MPYPHDVLHLRVQGVFSDNASPSIVPAEIVREWNEKWAYPQLRLATNSEFFTEAEERLAGEYRDLLRRLDRLVGRRHRFGCSPPRLQPACPGGRSGPPRPCTPWPTRSPKTAPTRGRDRRDYERPGTLRRAHLGRRQPLDGRPGEEGIRGAPMGDEGGFRAERVGEIERPRRSGCPPPLACLRAVRRLTRLRYRLQPQPLAAHRPGQRVRVREPHRTPAPPSPWSMVPPESVCPRVVEDQENAQFRVRGSRLTFIAEDIPACGYSTLRHCRRRR